MNKRIRNLMGSFAIGGAMAMSLTSNAQGRAAGVVYRAPMSASGIEKSLVGVRILQSYKTVLQKFGAPTRIYRFDESVAFDYHQDMEGKPDGGVVGLLDSAQSGNARMAGGGAGGGARMAGMGGGMMPGMGGPPPGMGSGGMMPGMGGGMPPQAMAAMMGAGRPGMGGGGMGSGGMMPGMGGGMPQAGAGGAAGRTAGASNANDNTFGASGGFQWVYLVPTQEKALSFFFNRDGRLEVIQEHGRSGGSYTSRGLTLGSPVQSVYQAYGWPESTENVDGFTVFSYLQKRHLQVRVAKGKVVGLIVTLRENQKVQLATGGAGAARPGAAGAGGGKMGAMMGLGGAPGGSRRFEGGGAKDDE